MAKEPEPKDSNAGNTSPLGSELSDYVSGRLNDMVIQKAEGEKQAALTKDRQMELFLQRTAPLREYLLELAAPMDELLTRFRVRELLEEVRSRYSRNGTIKIVVPDIYKRIVTQPDPSARFFGPLYNPSNGQPVCLDDLLGLGNFRSVVPSLIDYEEAHPKSSYGEYGLVLEREVQMRGEITRMVHGSPESRWLGPGGGYVFIGEGGIVAEGTGEWESYYGIESMFVEVVKSEELKPIYALKYSRRRSGDLVAHPRKIHANQPPEMLRQLIGDDIVKTISGNV